MNTTHVKRTVIGAVLAAASLTGAAVAAASSSSSGVRTPNECIHLNHGDYTACNVGNSGSGSQPYQRAK
jgi:hypothetical protein